MFDATTSWLLLDASGVTTRVGVWRDARWRAWREYEAPALEALFAGVQAVMEEAQTPFEKLGGYFYVEGPGSVLGLRLAAMAIRAWQTDDAAVAGGQPRPVFACGSLQLAAAVALAAKAPLPFAVFTEARQGHWHVLEVNDGDARNINSLSTREVGEHDLPAGPLYHLPARKAWHTPPARAQKLPAGLRDHPEVLAQAGLLRAVATPVPFTGAEPEYKKWAGAVK
ncbi:MAG TPA: hypothetical protein VK737_00840 [Opitutales bacterium]|jgi:tRNA threonylcarbamoyladenosine biosynthesis protein TsaB|nr:hypothetical protein [Opitutales bacterium]